MQPEPEDINDVEESQARASERRNFFLGTILSSDPHGKLSARVRNLSGGGMMIEFEAEPDPEMERGHRVVAELRNIGRVKGEIAWASGRRFGVKFDREIDPVLARQAAVVGTGTPDFVKPVLVPDRALKYLAGLGDR